MPFATSYILFPFVFRQFFKKKISSFTARLFQIFTKNFAVVICIVTLVVQTTDMRKFFSLVFILALTNIAIQAQQTSPGKKHLNWGLKSGVNLSTLKMEEAAGDGTKVKAGFVFGAYFKIKAGTNFNIQPEFLYSAMGAKRISPLSGDATFRLNYFSIPLLANYQFTKKWSALLGPQFDFLIIGKTVKGSEETEDTGSYEGQSINLAAGLEFWPCTRVGFSGRYIYGFTDISRDASETKNRGVQFTVALKL